MWELIVMGQIPGTQIQVTFSAWLFAMACLAMALAVYRVLHAALAQTDELVTSSTSRPVVYSSLDRRKTIPVATRVILAVRIVHAIQAAAFNRRWITRRQVQA